MDRTDAAMETGEAAAPSVTTSHAVEKDAAHPATTTNAARPVPTRKEEVEGGNNRGADVADDTGDSAANGEDDKAGGVSAVEQPTNSATKEGEKVNAADGDEDEGESREDMDQEEEEVDEEGGAYEEDEELDGEVDEDEEDYAYEVEGREEVPAAAAKPITIRVGNREYRLSAFVKNRGLSYVPGKLKSNPAATFTPCTNAAPHSILDCQHLHLNNRGILVRDRYIRLNMLVDNPAKEAMLRNPERSLKMRICRRDVEGKDKDSHNPATCSNLHLLPNIVFIGIPGLRTAYFEAELHFNLALTKLKEQPWETQCGTWCRAGRSHVVTTCRFVHYNRGVNYTEKPTPPHRPLAAIPDLTPCRPPLEANGVPRRGRGGRGARGGRGGRGRGGYQGRGGRGGRGRGGGAGRGASRDILPKAFRPGYVAPTDDAVEKKTATPAAAAVRSKAAANSAAAASTPDWMMDAGPEGRKMDSGLRNLLFVLLAVFGLLVAVLFIRQDGSMFAEV